MALSERDMQQLNEYNSALAMQSQAQQSQVNAAYYAQSVIGQQKQNIVEWELDFSSEFQDIIRLLRNDVLLMDENGNEKWIRNPDQQLVTMNDVGVNDIIRHIKLFLNKNKILANYNLDEINERVGMIKHELRGLIYQNYEVYGMDNNYKWNNYSMNVHAIGNMIEDAYRRALNGETHKGLNEQRLLTQTEPLSAQPQMTFNLNSMQKNKKWYAPWSWGR